MIIIGEALKELNEIKDQDLLLESSLSRLIKHNQSCMLGFITAFKSSRWIRNEYSLPRGASFNREVYDINSKRNDQLENNLKTLGYNYFRVIGSYENQERKEAGEENYTDKEQSFAMINTYHQDNFIEKLLELAKKYEQESILIIPAGGKNAKFYYTDGKIESAGELKFGKDAPFKSLVDGRPLVLEDISFRERSKIKSMFEYDKLKK